MATITASATDGNGNTKDALVLVEAIHTDSAGLVTVQRRKNVTGLSKVDVETLVSIFEVELDGYDRERRSVRVVER